MKAQEYKDYNKVTGYCNYCNIERPKEMFSPSLLLKDGTGRCKICDWIKRHNGIPIYKDFTEDEMYHIIETLFINDTTIINDLADEMNKDVLDIIMAIRFTEIGNKKFLYRYNCEYCGKVCYTNPRTFLDRKNLYCSHECYAKDKPNKVGYGENNICYNRVIKYCNNCGKELRLVPFRANQKNMFGESHSFCSQQCYWEFRSKYYRGDKLIRREITEETRERMRCAVAKKLCKLDRLDTKIQKITNDILDNLDIKYVREHNIVYYSIDNYLSDYNLMIEVQGDYWHCNPLIFNANKYLMNQKQYEGIHRDKIKHSYIKNHCNVEILYLWESDIEKRPDVCQALILLYVNNNGILSNYHSFNYDLVNGELKLKENLIIPYQDIPCNEYKYLLKNPA